MNQISPLAFVHPEAKLGDNNIIGPFCYIDRNTVIGDNNVMQNSVTIHAGARLGNNNEIFPGASIATKPQDLKCRKKRLQALKRCHNTLEAFLFRSNDRFMGQGWVKPQGEVIESSSINNGTMRLQ